jgi:hypothetical protein
MVQKLLVVLPVVQVSLLHDVLFLLNKHLKLLMSFVFTMYAGLLGVDS